MGDKCAVFYDSWQLECCGDPFGIGDTVKWLVHEVGEGGLGLPVDMGKVDHYYEAHSCEWQELFVLDGKVERIRTLYQRYEPSKDDPRYLVPVGGKLVEAQRAEGFEKDLDGLKATGYLVCVSGYTLRPAKKEEVTFK